MYKKSSRIILFIIAIVSVGCFFLASRLTFDYNFENFFPADDPELEFFMEFREQFENDNDFILVGIENSRGIFNKDFLENVNALTDSLNKAPLIRSVISPTTIKNSVIGPLGLFEVPHLHFDQPELYKTDSIKIYGADGLTGTIFSADAKSITLHIKTVSNPSKAKSDSIVASIEKLLNGFNFEKTHFAGKVKAQEVYITKMKKELLIFISSSALLVVLFLFISFRSWWGIWVPLLVVILSTAWLFAFMKLTGKPIDLMTTLLPTIMFVVGMSDVVHIISKYLEELRNGKHKINAIKTTLKEVGTATFLTSLTTAVGFLTLATASIKPVKEFGLYMAAGVFIAFILAFTLIPSILVNINRPKIAERTNNQLFWTKQLQLLLIWVLRRNKLILASTFIIVVVSIIGISQVKVNNFLLEDLGKDEPLKQDFLFFEENFSGVRPFEMIISVNNANKSVLDHDVLKEIEKVEHYLNNYYGAGFIISPLSVIKAANKAINGGHNENYKLPGNEEDHRELLKKLSKYKKRKEIRTLISEDEQTARITGKMHDVGSYKIKELNKNLDNFMLTGVNNTLLSYKLTGTARLIDKNNSDLALNMLQGLLIAFFVIALIVAFLFRSFKIIIVALIPNMLPLLMIGGIMGYFEMDLKVATSIIFTIAFGIAVDDTIHFLSKLKLELNKGKSMLYAIKRTFISTGKAIVVTSLILCGGFLTLVLSDFQSTFYIGLLISMSLLFAVMADLLLLPVLLLVFFKNKKNEYNKVNF